jgi:hypothetical protein
MTCSKIAHVAFLIAVAALLGCTSIAPSPSVPAAPDLCQAEEYRGMIGTPIAAATFPSGVRTIGPDTIITEDFVPGRLNVLIDSRGLITATAPGSLSPLMGILVYPAA